MSYSSPAFFSTSSYIRSTHFSKTSWQDRPLPAIPFPSQQHLSLMVWKPKAHWLVSPCCAPGRTALGPSIQPQANLPLYMATWKPAERLGMGSTQKFTKSQGLFDFASSMNFFSSSQTLLQSLETQQQFLFGSCLHSQTQTGEGECWPSDVYLSKLFIFYHKLSRKTDKPTHHTVFLLMFFQSFVKSHNKGSSSLGFCFPAAALCSKISFKYFGIPNCTLLCFTTLIIYQWIMITANNLLNYKFSYLGRRELLFFKGNPSGPQAFPSSIFWVCTESYGYQQFQVIRISGSGITKTKQKNR